MNKSFNINETKQSAKSVSSERSTVWMLMLNTVKGVTIRSSGNVAVETNEQNYLGRKKNKPRNTRRNRGTKKSFSND